MVTCRIGAAQLVLSDDDPVANEAAAERAVEDAAQRGLELVLLPELWREGYALDRQAPPAWPEASLDQHPMARWARRHGLIVAGTSAVRTATGLANRFLAFGADGSQLESYDKSHLFGPGGERRWFEPGHRRVILPVGPFRAGIVICYDLRFPEWSRSLCLAGADLLLVPAQWPSVRAEQFRTLVTARALENQVYVLVANRTGAGSVEYAGHTGLVDPTGTWLSEVDAGQEGIAWGEADPGRIRKARRHLPLWQDRRPDIYLPHEGPAETL